MRFFFILVYAFFFLTNNSFAIVDARIPKVPSELTVAGMKLKITDVAKRDIQKDVDALRQSPKYFNIKLDRAKLYFPIIEKIFKEEGIPDDFKFLAVQESALISDAVSSANAVGFWQFKDFTGREVGLRIDKNVDERLNIVSSTYGVSKYFKRHNFYFKNWIYTILAHMTGRGGAMKHVDKKQFGAKKMTIDKNSHWYVKRYLAHFIAFKDELKGRHSEGLSLLPYEKGKGKSLEHIARDFKTNYEEVSKYNKWLKKGKVPSEKMYTVLIPTTKKVKISPSKKEIENTQPIAVKKTYPNIQNRLNTSKTIFIKINGIQGILAKRADTADSLASKGNILLRKFLKYNDLTTESTIKEGEIYYLKSKRNKANIYFYTVSQKESMWDISQKFGIKVSKLAKLNRMLTIDEPELGRVMWLREKRPKDTSIEIKEIIAPSVYKPEESDSRVQEIPSKKKTVSVEENSTDEINDASEELPEQSSRTPIKIPPKAKVNTTVHTVTSGETLYSISKKYGVSVDDLVKWNNLGTSTLNIGQSLIVNKENMAKSENTELSKENERHTTIHIVKPGDTLYGISSKYGVSVDDILKWNNLTSTNLKLGQKLEILGMEEARDNGNVAQIIFHEVQAGDTLYGISKKYNISVKVLLEINNKVNTNLEIGEKIRVRE